MAKPAEVSYNAPIYLQLREVVRSKIEDGEYAPGTAIPSENLLASTYGINRLTVRSAIDALVNEGLLKRVQGKGVYVVAQIERDLEVLGGFTQTMNAKNVETRRKILSKGQRRAGEKYGADRADPMKRTVISGEKFSAPYISVGSQSGAVPDDSEAWPVQIIVRHAGRHMRPVVLYLQKRHMV